MFLLICGVSLVLPHSGISYDKPLPPIQVASQRAERIAKEKKVRQFILKCLLSLNPLQKWGSAQQPKVSKPKGHLFPSLSPPFPSLLSQALAEQQRAQQLAQQQQQAAGAAQPQAAAAQPQAQPQAATAVPQAAVVPQANQQGAAAVPNTAVLVRLYYHCTCNFSFVVLLLVQTSVNCCFVFPFRLAPSRQPLLAQAFKQVQVA